MGTTAGLFKSSSTVIVSQADLNDRAVLVDWTKPETIFAAPRVMGLLQMNVNIPDPELSASAAEAPDKGFRLQKIQLAEILQVDLRTAGTGKADGNYEPTAKTPDTAPISMSYTGVGMASRVAGPIFWSAWGYLGAGTTLTATGKFVAGKTAPVVVAPVYQIWKPTFIVNALGNSDVTILMPEWANTILDFGVTMGSWDEDGSSPDMNKAKGSDPTLYTGYLGVSRTGAAMIFSPQPTNILTTQLLWSFKPLASAKSGLSSLQVVSNAFAFFRPTLNAITESGLISKSSDLFLASEFDLSLALRPASDWGGNLAFAVMVPNTAALTRGIELKAQAGLNLSF